MFDGYMKLIDEKDEELLAKKEELNILEQKAKRIEYKVKAMTKYEQYLLSVKEHNPDEY